jgi:hypothetical protein
VIRLLFTIASALSLLLCVATLMLWVRDYRAIEGFHHSDGGIEYRATTISSGQFRYERELLNPNGGWEIDPVDGYYRAPGVKQTTATNLVGFGTWNSFQRKTGARTKGFVVSCWAIVIVSGLLPAWWILSRPRKRPKGVCHFCGYDLRASKDRCPECGTPITSIIV